MAHGNLSEEFEDQGLPSNSDLFTLSLPQSVGAISLRGHALAEKENQQWAITRRSIQMRVAEANWGSSHLPVIGFKSANRA